MTDTCLNMKNTEASVTIGGVYFKSMRKGERIKNTIKYSESKILYIYHLVVVEYTSTLGTE